MDKEKLEREAYEYFKSICDDYNEELERTGKRHHWVGFDIENAYIASAEPREKQIQIDAEQIRALQKQNGELTDRVRGLEQQIEKMKRCGNCKNYKPCSYWCTNREFYRNWNCVCEDWEIKEKNE